MAYKNNCKQAKKKRQKERKRVLWTNSGQVKGEIFLKVHSSLSTKKGSDLQL